MKDTDFASYPDDNTPYTKVKPLMMQQKDLKATQNYFNG